MFGSVMDVADLMNMFRSNAMAYGLVCLEASTAEEAEQCLEHQKCWYWYFSNGKSFPKRYIGMQWSGSTLSALNHESGSILCEICEPGKEGPVQLTSPHVKELIQQLRDYYNRMPKRRSDMSEHGPHGAAYLTIENIIATFDKMVKKFGDRAWVAIT